MERNLIDLLKRSIPAPIASLLKQIISQVKEVNSKIYIKQLLSGTSEICLEIGSGNKKGKPGWITLDVVEGCDLYWNLKKGIPFPDDSLSKIYSSHLFEHLSFKEGQQLFSECLRALKKGGLFSLCVPNAKLYVEAYIKNEDLDQAQFFQHTQAYNDVSRIDYLNYMAYMDGEHKYMFDEENIVAILKKQNFTNVHIRGFDPLLDTPSREFESIYAEASK
jgi:predicted SAM-dependent methyltransferase